MRNKLLRAFAGLILFLIPNVNFAQAPTLGTVANFVLYTTNGAVTNAGIPHLTHLTGDVGSNLAGSVSGFGNVDGVMHVFDLASGAAVGDLTSLYNQLNTAIPIFFPAPLLGGGATLVPGVYSIPSAATLNLNLILDAGGDPNAVFIFQIAGPLSTAAGSKVILANGALACNVFWKVEGLVSMAAGSTMRGNIVAHNAAINMAALDTLEGRALSINGAITTNSDMAYTPIGCGSTILLGPAAPTFVGTAPYGVLAGIGDVTSTPSTFISGDVGTNSGSTSGFDPLLVTGTIHPGPDASTAAAAADLTTVYNYLNALPIDIQLLDPANFGFDLVLTPHTYLLNALTMLNGDVYLNAQSHPNAVFVMHINGAFNTSSLSHVRLINGAKAQNVYWLINGATHIFPGSYFNGTIVGAGAITTDIGDTVNGRVMTINGAVAINGTYINTAPVAPCTASPITGTSTVCQGSTTTLSNVDTGGTWSSSNPLVATIGSSSGIVTGMTPGVDTITYTTPLACETTMIITVNASPAPILGSGTVCTGATTPLTDATAGGTWTSSNTLQATVGSASGIVTGVEVGTPTITYTLPAGCIATRSMTVNSATNAGFINGPLGVCIGTPQTYTDTVAGGVWTSSDNTIATVVGGVVTGVSSGIVTITYTVTSLCGTPFAIKTITVGTSTGAGTITGASNVCVGASTAPFTDTVAGGTWSSSNGNAIVGSASGIVTGVTAGTSTIMYTVISGCGSTTATSPVTVNPLPNAGVVSGFSNLCAGSSTPFTNGVAGGTWSSSNANATVGSASGLVTGVTAGTATIIYTVNNGFCTATATKAITVNAMPASGTISGASNVCVGSSTTLTDAITGGFWSSSNANATVGTTGTVTGVTAGTSVISYTVNNLTCSSTALHSITVNAIPSAGSINGLISNVCVGATIPFTETVAGGIWSMSNANATVGSTGNVTGVIAGLDTIIYTVSNPACSSVATKAITVNALADAGTITGPSNVCVGSAITLADAVTGGIWLSSNARATVTLTGGLVTGVTVGVDTISYTVLSALCGPATAIKVITVNTVPFAGSITGSSAVCVGSSITLANSTTGGVWSSSNIVNATIGTTGVVTGVAEGPAIIRYAVTTGCGSDVATKNITVNSLPAMPVIATQSPANVCVGAMYQNFGSATPPPAFTAYTWSAANAIVWAQGAGHQYALISFGNSGIATITLTATTIATGCKTNSNAVTVTVGTSAAETPEVVYFNDHFVCTPANEDAYQWGYDDKFTLDSTILTGEINQDYVNTNPGFATNNYWVMTTHGGCSQKTYYNVPTTVQNVNNNTTISVYPNPASTVVNVTASAIQGKMQIEVVNMVGQVVSTISTTNNNTGIDVANFTAGLYLVNCYSEGVKIANSKFIKN
jgi:uncharacterized protein YjdB